MAARVAASAAREPAVVALGDWAVCAADDRRRAWALEVARLADPDPWRNRVRVPLAWENRTALAALARTAPIAGQPASFLVALGERLRDLGGDGTAFLVRVQQVQPEDFWSALTLARVLHEGANPEAAVAPYRRAVEIRKDVAAVYNNLGLVSGARRDWNEAYDYYQKAVEIDTKFAPAYNNHGLALKGEGNWPEAVRRFREAVRLDLGIASGSLQSRRNPGMGGWPGRGDRPLPAGMEIDPEFTWAEYMLGVALVGSGPMKQANECYQRARRLDPADATAHNNIYGYAQAWGTLLYHWAFLIDPNFIPSHNNLGLSPGRCRPLTRGNRPLREGPPDRAWVLQGRCGTRPGESLGLGRFGDALAATRRCLDRLPQGQELYDNVLAQLKACEHLIALEDRLPAVLKDENKPTDMSETLEFAELCGALGHIVIRGTTFYEKPCAGRVAATRYGSPRCPLLPGRVHAALAGSKRGDGADLGRAERAAARKRHADGFGSRSLSGRRRINGGSHADCVLVRDSLTHLWADPDLAGLLDREPMDELSAAEHQEGHALWSEIDALIRRRSSHQLSGGRTGTQPLDGVSR